MKPSKFLRLNIRDIINGLILAILGAMYSTLLPAVMQWLSSDVWTIDIDVMTLVKSTISLGVLPYLTKNFFTKDQGERDTDWAQLIEDCRNLDDLGDLEDLPYEYYESWCAKYLQLGYPEPLPSYGEIRAGSVGTSGPKK